MIHGNPFDVCCMMRMRYRNLIPLEVQKATFQYYFDYYKRRYDHDLWHCGNVIEDIVYELDPLADAA